MSFQPNYMKSLPQDALAGLVVFLVALPLCLGVALASGAPAISGIVAGIVGGMLVVWVSGSHTSVSGPAAGLTAIVAAQIAILGSFEAFLVAVILAGIIQLVMAALRTGSLAAFFPSSVINGLLAAIGVILILKQIPHIFGHDTVALWLGDLSFQQMDGDNTLSELYDTVFDVHYGPTVIGLLSIGLMLVWDKIPLLKKLVVPAPLIVVLIGIALAASFSGMSEDWWVGKAHLVDVPVSESPMAFFGSLYSPDWSAITDPAIIMAAVTIALVASLETLLNVEAVDKLDPMKRVSPSNRELVAQGVGNISSGFLGGLPITSVIVRSSVNINSGGKTRNACFIHGTLLLVITLLLPDLINRIPLSALAAILLVTGFKLASPQLFKQMWREGYSQFLPFIITVVAIVLTDLLIGIMIGLFVASLFILKGNLHRPVRKSVEPQIGGSVTRIELAQHVSFLNRATLKQTLHELEDGSSVILDARNTFYIDPDIADLIMEFEKEYAPAHDINVSRLGFKDHYEMEDFVGYPEVTTREVQQQATPVQILQRLKEGNTRYVEGQLTQRDHLRQLDITKAGQFPLAVVLSCMDSRVHANMIFDLGLGDMFSVRVAGNIVSEEALGSMEYGCAVAGAKVIVVLGHTRCGAVNATVDALADEAKQPDHKCNNLLAITGPIAQAVAAETVTGEQRDSSNSDFVHRVTEINVRHAMANVHQGSSKLQEMIDAGEVLLAGGIYDVESGRVEFIEE